MTAPDGLEGETVRECIGNLAMIFRDYGDSGEPIAVGRAHFRAWASRLERAVRLMDEERAKR